MKLNYQVISIVLILGSIGSIVIASIHLNAYAAGSGKVFIAHAILKLKAHKNNPTQIPLVIREFRDELKGFLSSVKP